MSLHNAHSAKCPHCTWYREAAFAQELAYWLRQHCRQIHKVALTESESLKLVRPFPPLNASLELQAQRKKGNE